MPLLQQQISLPATVYFVEEHRLLLSFEVQWQSIGFTAIGVFLLQQRHLVIPMEQLQ